MGSKKEGSFAGWLQRVRKTGEHSDLTVKIQGQEFKLHILPLVNESTYFQSINSATSNSNPDSSTTATTSSSSSSGGEASTAKLDHQDKRKHHRHHRHHHHHQQIKEVAIDELPGGAAAFSIAADFCYIIRPSFTTANVAAVRAAAEFLGMADLIDSTKKFLYSNVFLSWKSCVTFLREYQPIYPSTDEYIELRALKVVTAACTKAFLDTKHVSVPISSLAIAASASASTTWHSSPSANLKDALIAVAQLPDRYSMQLLDQLVASDTNLNIKCRQSRSVREWIDYLLRSECKRIKPRIWIVLCLARMLLKNAPRKRPWLELSSQYWCSLLEHAAGLMAQTDDPAARASLAAVKASLQRRIGASLHELDDYIQAYSFEPETLLALVRHFMAGRRRRRRGRISSSSHAAMEDEEMEDLDDNPEEEEEVDREEVDVEQGEGEIEAVASEVDGCLWGYAESGVISCETFVALERAFPPGSRGNHDMLYSAVEKMIAKNRLGGDEIHKLWSFVDCSKLSSGVYDKAMRNASYLCQPHVLECVLRRHSEELDGDHGGHHASSIDFRDVMHKVIKASLKLLEENSRRSKEIKELQKQYAGLVSSGFKVYPAGEDDGGDGGHGRGEDDSVDDSNSTGDDDNYVVIPPVPPRNSGFCRRCPVWANAEVEIPHFHGFGILFLGILPFYV
ncbi:hypothetical protein SELMODRAFT_407558 [Selaginella moellendorffii]|uniref:NPH3 domain-containing protein n=1 Tax=Selaginella moellendorffii TaxID=88036 RepID=D8R600_SELML|nr:hypothetical protein SELMODRAFT_407558 [Selaginella moellendorffii]